MAAVTTSASISPTGLPDSWASRSTRLAMSSGSSTVISRLISWFLAPQLVDRLRFREDADGAARGGGDLAVEVDAEGGVDRRGDFGRADGTVGDVLAALVGGADDLAAPDPGAGKDHRAGVLPVVAARVLVDLR